MSRLNDALNTFYKLYREANPVAAGYDHDEARMSEPRAVTPSPMHVSEEDEVDFFPMDGSGGDASGKMAYSGKGKGGDGPKGFRDSGKTRAPEAEGDSRRGASDQYPVDDGDPDDAMAPGYRGPALDDDDDEEEGDPGSRGPGFSSEGRSKVSIRCPHCGEGNRVRLPKHLQLARMAQTSEARMAEGKILKTKCAQCGEAVRFTAPAGHSFVRRTGEAARHFTARYRYLTGRGGNPVIRGLRSAREAFRRSYFNR